MKRYTQQSSINSLYYEAGFIAETVDGKKIKFSVIGKSETENMGDDKRCHACNRRVAGNHVVFISDDKTIMFERACGLGVKRNVKEGYDFHSSVARYLDFKRIIPQIKAEIKSMIRKGEKPKTDNWSAELFEIALKEVKAEMTK